MERKSRYSTIAGQIMWKRMKRPHYITLTLLSIGTLLGSILGFAFLHNPNWKTVEDKSTLKQLNPIFEQRKSYKYRLSNGLSVYIVHDPKLEESGTALSVQAGSWDDPASMHGMAHFAEHMLFLGSKSYPEEGGYHSFIQNHGGQQNAYTMPDRTVYFMTCSNNAFLEGLDRFCDQIANPLFFKEVADREKHAIEEELQQKKNHDGYLSYLILCLMSQNNHDARKFHIGNLQTLKDVSSTELQEWWKEHYKAPGMSLVVFSPLPVYKIKKTISHRLLTLSPKARKVPDREPMWTEDTASKRIIFPSSDDSFRVLLSWPLAKLRGGFYAPKTTWIAEVLNHNEPGGFPHLLRQLEWAHHVEAGTLVTGKQGLFIVELDLTPLGYENRDIILQRIYELMSDLTQAEEIPEHLYQEHYRSAVLNYTYKGKSALFNQLANIADALTDEPIETFPDRTILPNKHALTSLTKHLRHILKQPFVEIDTIPKSYIEKHKISLDQQHPYLKDFFFNLTIDDAQKYQKSDKQFTKLKLFPTPNTYIPKEDPPIHRIIPLNEQKESKPPQTLVNNKQLTLYYTEDNSFGGAQSFYNFRIYTPSTDNSLHSLVLTELWLEWLSLHHQTQLGKAEDAGFHISFRPAFKCIELSISGWTSGIQTITQDLLKLIQNGYDESSSFTQIRDRLTLIYQNNLASNPIERAFEHIASHIVSKRYTTEEKLDTLQALEPHDLVDFCSAFFTSVHLDANILTPLSPAQVIKQAQTWRNLFPASSITRPEHLDFKMNPLRNGLTIKTDTLKNGNAFIYLLDHGSINDENLFLALLVLSGDISSAYYTDLRTQKQMGYIVNACTTDLYGQTVSYFYSQSSQYTPEQLQRATEDFLSNYIQNLCKKVNEENFLQMKASLLDKLQANPINGRDYLDKTTRTIYNYGNDKERDQRLIRALQKLDYTRWCTIIQQTFSKEKRIGISLMTSNYEQNESNPS